MSRMLGSILCLVTLSLPVVLSAPAEQKTGKIWAVLVAGSSGYGNYRHQADVCHAYQIFRRHGVPDSQIIVMMYDDIANHPENVKKGQIFNKPGGPNVYVDVPKDYTGAEVTPKNFEHVLTGNSSAVNGIGSSKVLKSGPDDHVFVNFVDHGAPGMVGFPGAVMMADDLLRALQTMHHKQMYKKLVFYLEACESGSMFKNILPNNIKIFATTAANPKQSSYACYWDNTLEAYLGDEYSIAWMEDIDSEEHYANLTTETLLQQYRDVVARVKKSQPSLYGETDLEDDHVVDFMGNGDSQSVASKPQSNRFAPCGDAVSSRDVALATLNNKLLLTNDIMERFQLEKKRNILLKKRHMVDQLFERIIHRVAQLTNTVEDELVQSHPQLSLDMMPCYRTLVKNFSNTCINISKNTYTLGHMYKLANLCVLQDLQVEDVLQVFAEECPMSMRGLSGVE